MISLRKIRIGSNVFVEVYTVDIVSSKLSNGESNNYSSESKVLINLRNVDVISPWPYTVGSKMTEVITANGRSYFIPAAYDEVVKVLQDDISEHEPESTV